MNNNNYLPKESVCVSCGVTNDSAKSFMDDKRPEPGNISMCLYCGHISVFADDLSLRPLTDQEMYDIAGDPTILAAQEFRKEYERRTRKK